MAFKLMQSAERSWRRLDAHHLLPLVRAGVRFPDGKQQEQAKELIMKQHKRKQRVAA
jgi:hypothetical protein